MIKESYCSDFCRRMQCLRQKSEQLPKTCTERVGGRVRLRDVFDLICSQVVDRRKGGRVPLMGENDFLAAVFTNELKMNYPYVLNPGHPAFRQKDFDMLAEKKPGANMLLQSFMLYFISHPAAIDDLCGSCRSFFSTRISVIHQGRFMDLAGNWYLQLHLNSDAPLSGYLKNSLKFSEPLQSCALLTTWMLLDALCSDPSALCLLYQKYSSADKSVPALFSCSKILSGLRVLHAHAVKAMEPSDNNEDKNKEKDNRKEKVKVKSKGKNDGGRDNVYFTLAREFDRMRKLYQKDQKNCPEKYRGLFQESLDYFDRFLLDLERKSPTPGYNLNFMKKDLEKLEELLAGEAL